MFDEEVILVMWMSENNQRQEAMMQTSPTVRCTYSAQSAGRQFAQPDCTI